MILYAEEHKSCYHYDGEENPRIEHLKITDGVKKTYHFRENILLFLRKGRIRIFPENSKSWGVAGGNMVALPASGEYIVKAEYDSELVIFRLSEGFKLCEVYPHERLYSQAAEFDKSNNILSINEQTDRYLDVLLIHIRNGLICNEFLDLKQEELLYLLRAYYPKEELAGLLYPLFINNNSFSRLIAMNVSKTKSAKQLAAMCDYSLSGFERRFKDEFGMSASRWMREEKAKVVYRDICCSEESFKALSKRHGFALTL